MFLYGYISLELSVALHAYICRIVHLIVRFTEMFPLNSVVSQLQSYAVGDVTSRRFKGFCARACDKNVS